MRPYLRLPWLVIGLSFTCLLFLACSDSETPSSPADGGTNTPKEDGGSVADAFVPTGQDCANDTCKEFVTNALTLPSNTEEARKLGHDWDGNGTPENKLAGILAALAAQAKGAFDVQEEVGKSVNAGDVLVLFRLQGGDFENKPDAVGRTWIGKATACCPTATRADPAACAAEAATTCYAGDKEFEVETPEGFLIGGSITNGQMVLGPSQMRLKLPLSSQGVLDLNLRGAYIKGKIDGDKIVDGVINGGITTEDLQNSVVPAVATLVDGAINDPDTSEETKTQLKGIFDGDGDGKITPEEVRTSPLFSTVVKEDTDVDGDGKKELTLGIGFTAVGSKILGAP